MKLIKTSTVIAVVVLSFSFNVISEWGNQFETIHFSQISKYGSFLDKRDNKTYKTITIGSQIWLAQNLNYKTNTGSWYYNDNSQNEEYGLLYNWSAAKQAIPEGWHLPSVDEWKQIINYLGDENIVGKKMKEKTATHWNLNNGSNSSGFTALPAGYRFDFMDGAFDQMGETCLFWSRSESKEVPSWYYIIQLNNLDKIEIESSVTSNAYSIRCIKDTD